MNSNCITKQERALDQPKQINKALVGIIVAVVLIGATVGTVYFMKKDTSASNVSTTTSTPTTTSETGTTTPSTTTSTGTYKDGTYSASSSYRTPESTESIDVRVTVANNVVTDVSVSQTARKRDSEFYQQQFADNYKSEVVGKNINEVSLSRVAGSSLTSGGFNSALDTIKQDAKA